MKRAVILSTILLCLFAALAGAQTLTHAATGTAPKTDGVIADKEYAVATTDATLPASFSWIGDTLYVAVSAKTAGWVAIGLGSTKMNNAIMYIGYVTGDQTQMKVQIGSGHAHADTASSAPTSFKMTESGGMTTLELALKAADFIKAGQKSLELIVAMGTGDSFISMHKSKAVATLALAQ
jgi:hypothetical protein